MVNRFGVCVAAILGAAGPLLAQEAGWSDQPCIPSPVGDGGFLVAADGDTLYAAVGGGLRDFYRHTVSTQTWTALAPAPAPVNVGSAMAYRPGTSLIYLLPDEATTGFHEYDATTNLWRVLAPLQTPAARNSTQMAATPDSVFVYFQEGAERKFRRFDPVPAGDGGWTERAYGFSKTLAALAHVGGEPDLFGIVNGGMTLPSPNGPVTVNALARYSIDGDSWEVVPTNGTTYPTSKVALSPGPGRTLFLAATDGRGMLFQYDIAGNLWSSLADPWLQADLETSLAWAGGNLLFVLPGFSQILGRHRIAENTFIQPALAPPIWGIGSNAAIVGAGDGEHLYALHGASWDNGKRFKHYSIADDSWEWKAGVPEIVGQGTSLANDGQGHIHLALGGNTRTFYRYSIAADSWEKMADLPERTYIGGQLALGGDGLIYAILKAQTAGLHRFLPPDADHPLGRWETRASLPGGTAFYDGMALTGAGNHLYAMRGNGRVFLRYSIATDSWEQRALLPGEPGRGSDLCYPGAGKFIYAVQGGGLPTFWAYSIPADSWTAHPQAPSSPNLDQSLANAGGYSNHIYLLAQSGTGFSRYSMPNTAPALLSVAQLRPDGTTALEAGGTVVGGALTFEAAATDAEDHGLRIEVEARAVGTDFQDSPTHSSAFQPVAPVRFPVSDIPRGASYRWQARVRDALGAVSAWMSFGTAAAAEVDFFARPNALPSVATIGQFEDGASVPAGGVIEGFTLIVIEAVLSDADGDRCRLEVEVRGEAEPPGGQDTITSDWKSAGQAASVEIPMDLGRWSWRFRVVDMLGEGSAWTEFGGSANADIVIAKRGSENGRCPLSGPMSAGTGAGGLALIGILLLIRRQAGRSGRRIFIPFG